jgi:hypothetical protein
MPAITEATLEMHFHASLMSLFRETYGLGPSGSIEFFKYSPQLEKFVGFDQAYVRTEMSEAQLFQELQEAASKSAYKLNRVLIGYFLQFKVVKRLVNRSRSMPIGFSAPYYRADLDTHRKTANDPSQHELLYSLAANPGAMVYYACPMVFDRVDLYRPEADLDQLMLADVTSAPGAYSDNERHFVCFQNTTSQPTWCSDPSPGKGINAESFVGQLVNAVRSPDQGSLNRNMVLDFLKRTLLLPESRDERMLEHVSESLTVIAVTPERETAASQVSRAK